MKKEASNFDFKKAKILFTHGQIKKVDIVSDLFSGGWNVLVYHNQGCDTLYRTSKRVAVFKTLDAAFSACFKIGVRKAFVQCSVNWRGL